MKTFTIDTDNNITAHDTPEEAAATTATPFDSFSSQQELAGLAAGWPAARLVAIWNSLPGVKPVKGFKAAKTAASRIWEYIQDLGEPEKPRAERKVKGGAQAAKGAPGTAVAGFSTSGALPNTGSLRAPRAHVGQLWRNGGQPLSSSQQPQLPRPIGKREAETLQV